MLHLHLFYVRSLPFYYFKILNLLFHRRAIFFKFFFFVYA